MKSIVYIKRKRKRSDLVRYDKSPNIHKKKIQKALRDNIKTPPKTSITQRLRTDLGRSFWSNSSHPTGVVKPVYERSTPPPPLTAKVVKLIVHYTVEILFKIQTDFHKDGYMFKDIQESNETLLYNLTLLK